MRQILIVLCLLLIRDAEAVDVIAHRGLSCSAPENSIQSIQAAWTDGANGVEIDLRVSLDGIVFLYHDNNIRDQPVADLTYSEIRSASSAGIAPTFASVLAHGRPPGYFILDLKEPDAGRYRSLPTLIAAAGADQRQFIIQSASVTALDGVRQYLPQARFFYLADLDRLFPFYRAPKPGRLLQEIEDFGFDGVSLKGRSFLNAEYVRAFKRAGYGVNVWTINDPERAHFYRDIGVDGIITDSATQILFRSDAATRQPAVCR